MSLTTRAVCRHRHLLLVRTIAGSHFDYGNIRKIPGFRKPPVPHEELLLENDGRYPPHLKIDMDHPENWPKHYPPFYESRRPARYPLLRAVFIAFGLYQAYLFWTNPMWLIPWVTPNFECISNEGNWVKLEDHDEKDRVYPWQKPLVEPELRSPEARRALGYNIVLEGEDKKL